MKEIKLFRMMKNMRLVGGGEVYVIGQNNYVFWTSTAFEV